MTIAYAHFNQPNTYQDLFLTTKLQPPQPNHPLVSRPRLLRRLEQGLEEKLTLICAPAGSGKTSLCIDWLHSSHGHKMPVAWISLDERDNNPRSFWYSICSALEQIHPNIGEQLSLVLQTSSQMSEVMLIRLMNLLAQVDIPFVLVLDDYHLVTTASIHHAVSFLLDRMPAHMHLVLLARFEPPLSLSRLRVRGQVIEIRETDLHFTFDEVEQFFTHTMRSPFGHAHIQNLTQRTEGWIAGLHLSALAQREQTDIDSFVASFTGSSRYIMDYFLEEVINHQSTEVQIFLLSTAILGRLCASLCTSVLADNMEAEKYDQQDQRSALTSNRQSQEMLEYLERMNLFIIPLDHQRRWYRYHYLFAEALQARLALLYPTLSATLHMRASTWYEQQGLFSEAIKHALAAKDVLRVCHLLKQVASPSTVTVSYWDEETRELIIIENVLEQVRPKYQQRHIYEQATLATCQVPVAAHKHLPEGSSEAVPSKLQPLIDPLSERELEVLHLLAVGAPNATIAQQLIIAPATVKRHLSNIFSKLDVANRTQAAAQARVLGII